MTPFQHFFPYFFDLDKFNKELKPLQLYSYVTSESKTKMPESLVLSKHGSKDVLLSISFGTTLMVQGDKLLFWQSDYDLLDISVIQLINISQQPNQLNRKIDLLKFKLGHNQIDHYLNLCDFVTFVRKEDLKYEQDYYEKFVIVIINNDDINIIPFDWFNKTGGDYGYVWPATARLDKGKLYGQGMRMNDFTVELDDPSVLV
jgi:hypothetical protein